MIENCSVKIHTERKMSTQIDAELAANETMERPSIKRDILSVGLIFTPLLIAMFCMKFPESYERHVNVKYYPDESPYMQIIQRFVLRLITFLITCMHLTIWPIVLFYLPSLLGRKLFYRYFPDKAKEWAIAVARHPHLLNYILFLRIMPISMLWNGLFNVSIIIASSVIGVPKVPLIVGTFFGIMPRMFIVIQTTLPLDSPLSELESSSDMLLQYNRIILFVFALLSLLPIMLYKQKLKQK